MITIKDIQSLTIMAYGNIPCSVQGVAAVRPAQDGFAIQPFDESHLSPIEQAIKAKFPQCVVVNYKFILYVYEPAAKV